MGVASKCIYFIDIELKLRDSGKKVKELVELENVCILKHNSYF